MLQNRLSSFGERAKQLMYSRLAQGKMVEAGGIALGAIETILRLNDPAPLTSSAFGLRSLRFDSRFYGGGHGVLPQFVLQIKIQP